MPQLFSRIGCRFRYGHPKVEAAPHPEVAGRASGLCSNPRGTAGPKDTDLGSAQAQFLGFTASTAAWLMIWPISLAWSASPRIWLCT